MPTGRGRSPYKCSSCTGKPLRMAAGGGVCAGNLGLQSAAAWKQATAAGLQERRGEETMSFCRGPASATSVVFSQASQTPRPLISHFKGPPQRPHHVWKGEAGPFSFVLCDNKDP